MAPSCGHIAHAVSFGPRTYGVHLRHKVSVGGVATRSASHYTAARLNNAVNKPN
jgi:hypothetical protein